jgi:hypothetical protein
VEPSLFVFLVVLVVGAAVLARRQKRPDTSNLFVKEQPATSINRVVTRMAQSGYVIAYRDSTTATFTRPKKPDLDIAVLLLLLGIIPGLLYIGLYRGTATTTVVAVEGNDATQLLLSGDDYRVQAELVRWFRDAL